MHSIRKLRSSQSPGGLHVTLQLRNGREGASIKMFREAPQLGCSAGSSFSEETDTYLAQAFGTCHMNILNTLTLSLKQCFLQARVIKADR